MPSSKRTAACHGRRSALHAAVAVEVAAVQGRVRAGRHLFVVEEHPAACVRVENRRHQNSAAARRCGCKCQQVPGSGQLACQTRLLANKQRAESQRRPTATDGRLGRCWGRLTSLADVRDVVAAGGVGTHVRNDAKQLVPGSGRREQQRKRCQQPGVWGERQRTVWQCHLCKPSLMNLRAQHTQLQDRPASLPACACSALSPARAIQQRGRGGGGGDGTRCRRGGGAAAGCRADEGGNGSTGRCQEARQINSCVACRPRGALRQQASRPTRDPSMCTVLCAPPCCAPAAASAASTAPSRSSMRLISQSAARSTSPAQAASAAVACRSVNPMPVMADRASEGGAGGPPAAAVGAAPAAWKYGERRALNQQGREAESELNQGLT